MRKKSARQTSARMKSLTGKALKHGNNVLLWLRIKVVSRESNSTAELTLMWMYVALYIEALAARTATAKADRGDIFIVHDQKSSYRTPLIGRFCFFIGESVLLINTDTVLSPWPK